MATKLTDGPRGNITKAQPPERGQRFIYDSHRDAPRGFGLRITPPPNPSPRNPDPKPRKTFVLRYTVGGVERRMKIGHWPDWSLEAARTQARHYRQEIDAGRDILQERRDEGAEPTLADAVKGYCQQRVDGLMTAKSTTRYFERDVVPVLGRRKIRSIRRRDVVELVENKAAQTPRAAHLLLTHLKGLFAWAEHKELIDGNPVATIRPKNIGESMKPRKRGRVLDDAEIRGFWNNAEECGMHKLMALALKLVLVTGQRPGEVAGMRHSEIDGNVWTIPGARRGKNEVPNSVPLTDTALEIIKAAKAEVDRLSKRRKWRQDKDVVFTARSNGGVTVPAMSRAVHRYAKALENKEADTWGIWLPHDLRRTCRTGLASCQIPETVAERVIGHGPKGIVANYDVHRYDDEKRAALETWERRIQAIVTGKSADVVEIREARA